MHRTILTTAILLTLTSASTPAHADAVDAVYHYGSVGAQFQDACNPGVPELIVCAELGTLKLYGDNTWAISGTQYAACTGGGTAAIPFGSVGSYTLSPDGELVLTEAPPGTDVSYVHLSTDGELLLSEQADFGVPMLVLGIREGAGMDDSLALGTYTLGTIGHSPSGGAISSFAAWGSADLDGAGSISGTVLKRDFGPTGTSLVTNGIADTYSVAANGQLTTGGGQVGALSSDGRLGFVVRTSGSYYELSIFLRRPTFEPSPGYLDDGWNLDYGSVQWPGIPSGCIVNDGRGLADFDGLAGTFTFNGSNSWVDEFGEYGGPDSGAGTFVTGTGGEFGILYGGPHPFDAWLGEKERVFLFAQFDDLSEAGLGIALRRAEPAMTPYCFGDGAATTCPCSNDNDGSRAAGHAGCENGSDAGGAALAGIGGLSLAAADLTLVVEGLPPSQPGLFFQANNQVNGGVGLPFGDGLRCAGGALVRLGVKFSDAAGHASSAPLNLGVKGGVRAGDLRRYQFWYRDPVGTVCGYEFNVTNGLEGVWLP